jgi:hypothetical protein
LGIAVRMILPFLQLAIALQAVALIVQQLGHFLMTDRMLLPGQFPGERPGTLARPAQRGFRIAPRARFNQPLQGGQEAGIMRGEGLPARPRSSHAPDNRRSDYGANKDDATQTMKDNAIGLMH